MFIPAILSVPVLSALGIGAVPVSGAVLPWMLIVAFMGSVLGVLREGLRGTERTRMAKKRVVESHLAPVPHAHDCREAA